MGLLEEWDGAQGCCRHFEEYSRQFEGTITIDQIHTHTEVVTHLFIQMENVEALENAFKDEVAGLHVRLRNSEVGIDQVQRALKLLQRVREVKEKLRAQVENVRNIIAEENRTQNRFNTSISGI